MPLTQQTFDFYKTLDWCHTPMFECGFKCFDFEAFKTSKTDVRNLSLSNPFQLALFGHLILIAVSYHFFCFFDILLMSNEQGSTIWAATSENWSSGFPTKSDTNRAAQLLNMARGLKFWSYEVEGLYYPCSENKGADQLCGYRTTDLRLCFRICKNPVFSRRGLYMSL